MNNELPNIIANLDARISNLEQATISLADRLANVGTNDSPEPAIKVQRDDVWLCENCGSRLGVYNTSKEELRVKYKDFAIYIHPGKGGQVKHPCRKCGEINILSDTQTT